VPGRAPNPDSQAAHDRSAAHAGEPESAIVTIASLDQQGRGVARVGGKAVFIEGALPGEQVRFRYRTRRRRYDLGRAVEVLAASPDRVEPRCRYFGVCGGCSQQHLRPEAQLAAKQQVLHDNLEHIAGLHPPRWLAPLAGPTWGYRRRARLGVRLVPRKGGVLVGFREKNRSLITPLAGCEVLDPRAAALLPALPATIAALSRPDRIPQVEIAAGDDALALVIRHLEPLTAADCAALAGFGRAHDVQVYVQPGRPETARALWPETPAALGYRLPEQGIELEFAPTDFIQVNAELNRRLVAQALTLLAPRPSDHVLDLFCGLGNFSLALARRSTRVLGLEGDRALVDRAGGNALRNGLGNVEFRAADLERAEGPDPWAPERFDLWLLDPPRTGALTAVQRLPPAGGPRRVLYVSCHPATLARDAAVLTRVKGYRLTSAGVMDMFPQTSHVEAMAVFERPA
jgi:23S rRNA (uracil1939-C5)-methyltransferase